VGRKQRIPDGAEGSTVYLTPEDSLMLRAIQAKRKKKGEPRTSLNEIWMDALWRLAGNEGLTRKKLEAFLSEK
jgi:hypothetical protein